MTRRARIMRGLSRAAYGVALMIVGGKVLAEYLIYVDPAFAERLQPISSTLQLVFLLFVVVGSSLDRRKSGDNLKEPSPRYSGVAVVALTGFTAVIAVYRSSYLYAALIAIGTIVAGAVVWRFATNHAREIGEARFPNVPAPE